MARWRLTSAILLVLVAFAGSGVTAIRTTLDDTRPDAIRGANDAMTTFTCLERRIIELAPADARLVVSTDEPFLYQRITEIAYPHRQVVANSEDATHNLIVTRDVLDPDCADVRLGLIET